MRNEETKSVSGLRSRAIEIPMEAAKRAAWADRFNQLPAMTHFGATLDLSPRDGDRFVSLGVRPKIDILTIRELLHAIDVGGQARTVDQERGCRQVVEDH